jgi:beta-xylosidase
LGVRAPDGGTARSARLVTVVCVFLAVLVPLAVVGAPSASSPTVRPRFTPVTVSPVALADPGIVLTPGQAVPNAFIVRDSGLYYMFASQEQYLGPNVPVMVSSVLTSWQGASFDAMPTLPPWAEPGFTWSPDVRYLDGHWVMWFNAALAGQGLGQTKCIGVATSRYVFGPYTSSATAPLVCQLNHLGSIDPRTFVDPAGRLWLLWKSDDNADVNGTTHSTIWVQQLARDGLQLLGKPIALLTADQSWEGRIVEAPDMVFAAGHLWLFFSANWFNQPVYSIGVAECESPTGPCVPTGTGPWMASNAQGQGPGEESLFYDGSRWWMLYAPFAANLLSNNPRPVAIARLLFGTGGPVVVAPSDPLWDAAPGRLRDTGPARLLGPDEGTGPADCPSRVVMGGCR